MKYIKWKLSVKNNDKGIDDDKNMKTVSTLAKFFQLNGKSKKYII